MTTKNKMGNITYSNKKKTLRLFLFVMFISSTGSYLKDDLMISGIPFNLPDTRYCAPCELTAIVPQPDEGVDKFCLEYVYENLIVEGRMENFDSLRLLLERFQKIGHAYFNLLLNYIKAKDYFLEFYNSTYTYSVFVVPTPDASSCVKVFQEGRGFQDLEKDYYPKGPNLPMIIPGAPGKTTAQRHKTFVKGLQCEVAFLKELVDTWVVHTCQNPEHLYQFQIANKTWMLLKSAHIPREPKPVYILETPYLRPAISERFSRPCADNITVPSGLLEDVEECRDMFCIANSPKRVVIPSNTITDDGTENRSPRRFLINEFHPFNPQFPNQEEFIEIRVVPPHTSKTKSFPTMRTAVFTVYTKRLLLVVNLVRLHIPDSGFFYIQGSNREASYVQTSDDLSGSYKLLPPGNEPIAIVLLEKTSHRPDSSWDRIQLQRGNKNKRRSVQMEDSKNSDILNSMHTFVIDAVLYGVLRNEKVPPAVRQLLPLAISGCNYILPLGDVTQDLEMKSSFNLCGEFDPPSPFQFDKFKLGNPSMGLPNHCNPLTNPQIHKVEHSGINAPSVGVTVAPEKPQDCPRREHGMGNLIIQIESIINYIKQNYNPQYSTPFYPTSNFRTTKWPEFLNKLERRTYVEDLQLSPFEEIEDSVARNGPPGAKLHRCSLCSKRLEGCPATATNSQKRSGFITGRQLPTDLPKMRDAYESHLNTILHLTSVLYEVEKDRIMYQTDTRLKHLADPYRVNRTERYRSLANIMDITFTFIHTNTAPSNAAAWYRTLKKIEAEVGASHHSRETAFAIINFIADVGSAALTEYLIANDNPFSLILDGSSDTRNYHYVLVYIQSLEGGVTISYLFFLLELKTSFAAQDYLDAIQTAVSAKGKAFNDYFKRRIVGVVTDSASVMKRFHRLLNTWLERKDAAGNTLDIVSIYCLAHKLQLASRSAIVPLKTDRNTPIDSSLVYFSILEKNMQQIYVWFKWSAKRIGMFREISDLPKTELKELHLERWISSEYKTVKNFILSWKTARTAVERMATDKRLDKRTMYEAVAYVPLFRDKTALITLHFLWDYTSVFKIWSEYLQKMSGLIIDQRKYFDQLMENLRMLEDFHGPVLLQFLSMCTCDEQECTLESYESSATVTWNGMEFSLQNEDAPIFSVAASALLAKTRERLNVYIPFDLINAADVLRPQRFPPGTESLNYQHPIVPGDTEYRIYGEQDISTLSNLLGFETTIVLQEWAEFVLSLERSASWEAVRQIHDSNMFWAILLRDTSLSWTPNLQLFIKSIKTLAPGSVACETGFSIFNVIKSKTRTSLKDSNTEAIMKILINGPGNVDMFDSYRYANYWVLGGHRFPKSEEKGTESVCRSHDGQIDISSDVGYNEPDIEILPGQKLDNLYSDTYTEFSKTEEFAEYDKRQRTKSRFRSAIM